MRIPLLTQAAQRGQGMTEYMIIVALIVIAAIGAYSFFGQTTRQQELPEKAAKEMAGSHAAAGQTSAKPRDTGGTGEAKGAGVSR